MQTVLGASRLHWLGAELTGAPIDTAQLYDFCIRALGPAWTAASGCEFSIVFHASEIERRAVFLRQLNET
jgi:hypothetical protein